MEPLRSLNGQPKRQPLSGLRTIKRDWSDSQAQSASSQASQLIDWPSSPERPSRPKPTKPTGYDERVARIQAALESNRQSSREALSSSSSVPQKRESESYTSGSVAKKRVLPSGWSHRDTIKQEPRHSQSSGPSVTSASSFGSASIAPKSIIPQLMEEGNSPAVARIFLSVEQQQILKLVEAGNNVFFTGSAGELLLNP